jgi:hypothetical protein
MVYVSVAVIKRFLCQKLILACERTEYQIGLKLKKKLNA